MEALFQNVLTASFHGSVVIGAVVLLRLLLKNTPKKFLCLMWMLAFIRLLMPFEIQSDMSLQPQPREIVRETYVAMPFVPRGDYAPAPEIHLEEAPQRVILSDNVALLPETTQPQTGEITVVTPEKSMDWQRLIPRLWLAVAGCFGLHCVLSYLHLKRRVRFAVKIPGGWECDNIDTAFILGFIRPKIYIPMGMPPAVRSHILAHERTHLEKGDHWIKMTGYVALAIHWFNPFVWVAYILLCKDIEMACDERVVQFMELEERKAYSAALLTCSTNRAHFAACPVAFGEVSVKERIMKVLHYRRPSFWISLLGVVAIVFLVVCLMTSPAEPPAETAETQAPETTEAPAETMGSSVAHMSEAELLEAVMGALEVLWDMDSYFIQVEHSQQSSNVEFPGFRSTTELRRCGQNAASFYRDMYSDSLVNSWMFVDGESYRNLGDYWVKDNGVPDYHADQLLKHYIPENITIFDGSQIMADENTIGFRAQWKGYEGEWTVALREDGDPWQITREYSEEYDEETIYYLDVFTVLDAAPEEMDNLIRDYAEQAVSSEEVERLRREAQQVSEIPSNKTDYDKDYMLGSGQMGWQMLEGEWFFKFGAENVTATGLTLVVEYSGPYGDNTVSGGTVQCGTEYFIERLVNDEWVTVAPVAAPVTPIAAQTLSTGSRQTINWKGNYGELPGGFYRIGNYYTVTSNTGETDTKVCYAKFRLYDGNHELLLKKAQSAIEELIHRENYHIYAFDWMTEHNYEYYMSSEVWKHGKDYLQVTRYPYRSDTSKMWNLRGTLWRDGKYYGLEWTGEPVVSEVSYWWQGVDRYMDDSNFSMWSWDFQWYDANVELVYEEGDNLHILQTYTYNDQYECSEITLRFDRNGKLCGMVNAFLPSRNCAENEKIIRQELKVLDTTVAEISATIENQNVTEPMPFSYAEDVKGYPNARTEGFVNTRVNPITTCVQAVALADKECDLDRILDFDNGYLQTEVSHDEEAGIWRVRLFWWQHDTAQIVYLSDKGITQMVVSVE